MNVNQLILNFLKKNKTFMCLYTVFMISYPISSVLLPKYYSQIIDSINEDKVPDFTKTILIFVLNNSMFLILDKVDTVFMPKLQSYLRNNIVKTVLNSYKTNFEEQNFRYSNKSNC